MVDSEKNFLFVVVFVSFFRAVEREWTWCVCVFVFFCLLFLFFFFSLVFSYASISSIGMVLAVEVGLKDGMDSMSLFIIHPS